MGWQETTARRSKVQREPRRVVVILSGHSGHLHDKVLVLDTADPRATTRAARIVPADFEGGGGIGESTFPSIEPLLHKRAILLQVEPMVTASPIADRGGGYTVAMGALEILAGRLQYQPGTATDMK